MFKHWKYYLRTLGKKSVNILYLGLVFSLGFRIGWYIIQYMESFI